MTNENINEKLDDQTLTPDNFDSCLICGEKSPYLISTDIYYRIGYTDGFGQGCWRPKICEEL